MPLPVLGALVVLGIGGLVLLIHFLGWTRRPQYADETEATEALLTDYPHASVRRVALADDRRAALFELAEGVGFAAPFGEGRLTRVIGPGDVRRVDEGPEGLIIRLTDYTAPQLTVTMTDPASRQAWAKRLMNEGEAK